jgi:hypothetical protein
VTTLEASKEDINHPVDVKITCGSRRVVLHRPIDDQLHPFSADDPNA